MQQQLTLKYWVHSEKSFLPLNPQKGTFKLADFQLFPFQGSGVRTIENKNSYFSEWTQVFKAFECRESYIKIHGLQAKNGFLVISLF